MLHLLNGEITVSEYANRRCYFHSFHSDIFRAHFRICGKRVTFAPALPKRMTRVVVRFPEWDITAEIDNTGEGNTWGVSVDGIRYNTDWIALGESLRGKKVKIVKMNV